MIVVMLIAVLYAVFISRMSANAPKDQADEVTLKTLKNLLIQFPAERTREIICTDPCKQCRIYLDGTPVENSELPLFKEPPVVFVRDRYGQYRQKEFLPLYDPEVGTQEVCFRFEIFRNGSSSHYIVQSGETQFYIYKPYLMPVKEVATLEEAQAAFDSEPLLPTERRDYTF